MPGCPGATASAWTLPWRAVGLQVPAAAAAGAVAAAARSASPKARALRDGGVRRAVLVMADLLEIGLDSTPACPAGRVAIREGRHQRQELLVGEIRIARICRQDIFSRRRLCRPQGRGWEIRTPKASKEAPGDRCCCGGEPGSRPQRRLR